MSGPAITAVPTLHHNRLLAALSAEARRRIFPHLELESLPLGTTLREAGAFQRHVYFPIDSIVSLLHALESGATAEISVVGNEGLIGVASFMGGESTPNRAVRGRVWMFYVRHQFEDAYWERGDNWDYTAAALQGSSSYQLPRILQWFSGNIGLHHIHHLSQRIPNYSLQRCHDADPLFKQVKPITFGASLRTLAFAPVGRGDREADRIRADAATPEGTARRVGM